MIKLILVSAFYIGRLDTPLLAEGVGNIGPIPIDALPIQFHKDLVLHDAHRHRTYPIPFVVACCRLSLHFFLIAKQNFFRSASLQG